MRNLLRILLALSILLVVGIYLLHPAPKNTPSPSPTPSISVASQSAVLGVSGGCKVQNALPDKFCTQGATIPGVTASDVCKSGYAKSVRDVSESEKDEVYKEYGVISHTTGEYEVDHLISLELGGSNDLSNLWPEAAEPRPGFHEKDKVENYLHSQVCSGAISLEEAQKEISNNWLDVYSKINGF